jgi:hypothetical protein
MTMPNLNDLAESKYLKKEDVVPEVNVTIAGYEEVDVSKESDAARMKWVLTFKELDKPLVLNKTNGNRLAKITGSGDFDDWVGKKVRLYNDEMVEYAGKITGGIRIKPVAGTTPDTTSQLQPETQQVCDDAGLKPVSDDDIPF